MIKKAWKNIGVLLLAAVLMFSLIPKGFMLPAPNLDTPCTVRTDFSTSADEEALQWLLDHETLKVDIYLIATAENATSDGYDLVPEPFYAGLDFSDRGDNWTTLSQEVAKIALEGDLRMTKLDTQDFPAAFTDRAAGLYLVVARGDSMEDDYIRMENGELYTLAQLIFNGELTDYLFSPALISVPQPNNRGDWDYDCTAFLKPHVKLHAPEITITKVDEEDHSVLLPGAAFELYSAIPVDPVGKTITTYVEGMGEVTLYQIISDGINANADGTYVTDANGRIRFYKPTNVPPGTLFALVETEAPAGYVKREQPYYFFFENMENTGDLKVLDANNYDDQPVHAEDSPSGRTYTVTIPETIENPVYVRFRMTTSSFANNLPSYGYMMDGEGYAVSYEMFEHGDTFTIWSSVGPTDEPGGPSVFNTLLEVEFAEPDADGMADWGNAKKLVFPTEPNNTAFVLTADDNGDYAMEAGNSADSHTMPEVGGMGTTLFTAGGLTLLLAALALVLKRRALQK